MGCRLTHPDSSSCTTAGGLCKRGIKISDAGFAWKNAQTAHAHESEKYDVPDAARVLPVYCHAKGWSDDHRASSKKPVIQYSYDKHIKPNREMIFENKVKDVRIEKLMGGVP